MSTGSDTDAAVRVESDGLDVEKRFTADEFPVPAVQFTLRSERDAPAEFRLVDHIPEEVPMDHIGFHPDYDNDGWTAYQDRRVEYRRRLDPGEEVTTVYGIRTDDPETSANFLGEPTVEEVDDDDADPAGGVAEVIGADSSQVVREVLSGDREAVPGGEAHPNAGPGLDLSAAEANLDPSDDADAAVEEVEENAEGDVAAAIDDAESGDDVEGDADAAVTDEAGVDESDVDADVDVDAGDADAPAAPEDRDESERGTDREDHPRTGADADAGDADAGIASALAAELRAGGVDAEDRETLRRELELDHSTSVDARISRLQSDVADVAAYTDALETFLDDNGTAEELADDIRDDVDDIVERIAAVEADVAAADDRRDDLEAGLDDVRSDVEGVGDDLSTVTDDLESSVASVRADLDDLAAEVAEEDDGVADVRDDLASLQDEIESLSGLVDEEVSDLRAELAAVRDEMEEFEAFRERLSSVFGADGGRADGTDADGTADDE